jgi:hypothetical protein
MKITNLSKDLKYHVEKNQYNPLHIAEEKKVSKRREKKIGNI